MTRFASPPLTLLYEFTIWRADTANRNIRQRCDLSGGHPRKETIMKLTTIALAGVFALSSTFALAQSSGGSAGGSSTAGPATAGTTTGNAAGTLNSAPTPAPYNSRNPSGSTVGARPSPSGSTLTPTGPGSGLNR